MRIALWMLFAGAGAASLSAWVASPKSEDAWREQGLVFVDHSWNARLRPIPASAVHLRDGFWLPRRKAVTERSLPTTLQLLEASGVVDNFRRISGRKQASRRGSASSDAELYEWIIAASAAITSNETSGIDKNKFRVEIDELTSEINAAQRADGYINTFYLGPKGAPRSSDSPHSSDALCFGKLIGAGIAYYRATGQKTLLSSGTKAADFLLNSYGPTKQTLPSPYGDLQTALLELFRTTDNNRYLELARYLFSGSPRGQSKDAGFNPLTAVGSRFVTHTQIEGNAVQALDAAVGATDYQIEAGDPAVKRTLDSLWADLTQRRMSITGGLGVSRDGEQVSATYEVPGADLYGGTCAAAADVMWSLRMLTLTGAAQYADVLERALYNAVNAGMTLSGMPYCRRSAVTSLHDQVHPPVIDDDCCASRLEALFENLPGLMYATGRDGIYVNLYHASELAWHVPNRDPLRLTVSTNYPWSGNVRFTVGLPRPQVFAINLRWPAWAGTVQVAINGQPVALDAQSTGPNTYIPLSRLWHDGDVITMAMPMRVSEIGANPLLRTNYGRIALQCGALVYAIEDLDQGGAAIKDAFLTSKATGILEWQKALLGGLMTIKVPALLAEKPLVRESLYQAISPGSNRRKRPVTLTFIPFYAINNRESTTALVWAPVADVYGSGGS